MVQSRIVCAANKSDVDGFLIISARHFDKRMHEQINVSGRKPSEFFYNQGFIDQFGTWWDREDALRIATEAGQINKHRKKTFPEDQLFSEDLY